MNPAENTPVYTAKQFCVRHPAFTIGSLRWLIFHEKSNGLEEAKAIIRVGRKVLIHEERFFQATGVTV
ncbi:MAG: hypothetical protein HQL72_12205 [Magnetococcales bacterium]|nr:hypothetical protein [Magnetococcales bacterium]